MSDLDAALIGVFEVMSRRITLRKAQDSAYDIATGTVNSDPPVDVTCWATIRDYNEQELGDSIESGDQRVSVQAAQLKGIVPTSKDSIFLSSGNPGKIISVKDVYTGARVSEYILTVRMPRGR